MSSPQKNSQLIKSIAKNLGFDFCGLSKASFLEEEAKRVEDWLSKGYQGQMHYLENYFDQRLDPRLLVPGAKTVVSLMYNYYPSKKQNPKSFQIAKYAYGADYHDVVKEKCKELLEQLKVQVGDVQGRAFVDSAPVLERAWAMKSGLGWIGRHGLLINKTQGSFFFLAELIIDLECAYDGPIKDYCGTCTKCVDECPTEAILPNKTLDASKCISYLTIELKEQIPTTFQDKMKGWAFGCDICQDVCPWNRFSKPHNEPRFEPSDTLLNHTNEEWLKMEKEQFDKVFRKSAVKRTKYEGFKRNLMFLAKKK